MSKKEYVVNHGNLFLSVGGKVQKVKKGHKYSAEPKQVVNLVDEKKLILASDVPAVNESKSSAELKKQVQELNKKVEELTKANEELTKASEGQ